MRVPKSLNVRQLLWSAIALVAFAIGVLMHVTGYSARVEHALAETRARLLSHEVDSPIVIVGIDAQSLTELSEWPWPRRHHARLLQMLDRSAPERVFFDIDFSSPSPSSDDDALFEQALADWHGPAVQLAAHTQLANGTSGSRLDRVPLPRFERHARTVSVMLEPGPDGLVREIDSITRIGGRDVSAAFADGLDVPPATRVQIDYSIDPASFGYVPYSDLVNGEIDPASLSGRTIFVGATAVELGDAIPVPVYRTLPGVVVQALSAETVRAGMLRTPPLWLYGFLLGAWTLAISLAFARYNWRINLAIGGLATGTLLVAATYAYAMHRVDLPVVPFLFVAAVLFVAAALRLLEYQTWRALAYSVRFRHRDALLRSVVESSTDCILCTDHAGIILTSNPSASRLFNAPARSLLGRNVTELIPNLRSDPASFGGAAGGIAEYYATDPNGRRFPVEVSFSRVALEDKALFTAIVRDITERKVQEAQLEHQATHDPLTFLPNRTAVMTYLEELLSSPTPDQRVAVLMLDLCRFKEVNDTLGHDVGDEVLREVARRFSVTLTDAAFIGRIGGDEFIVVMPQVSRRMVIDDLSDRLVECLQNPIRVRGIALEVGLSIGISLWPEHAADAQELLRHADIAMYAAKHRRSAYEYYSREHDQHTVRRLSMVSDLRSALSREEIELLYQPQVDLKTGKVISVEALLRWHHPVHGSVSPSEFISIAESTDIIRPLTEWTITEALKQMEAWDRNGVNLRVAVNLSARALQDADFPRHLQETLDRYSVDAARMELEITETAMMLDPGRAQQIVRELQAIGVRISIDDFGTGFSSLGYLRDLRVDALKLDKSFVMDLETNEQNRVIVESTIHMAEALGLEMVAEGVETEWVSRYLAQAGYHVGQGYWFARPMSAAACTDLITGTGNTQQRRIARVGDESGARAALASG